MELVARKCYLNRLPTNLKEMEKTSFIHRHKRKRQREQQVVFINDQMVQPDATIIAIVGEISLSDCKSAFATQLRVCLGISMLKPTTSFASPRLAAPRLRMCDAGSQVATRSLQLDRLVTRDSSIN